jgi:glyoxylase-like metal-dependent hydrolase (beta-lactamase superfamily II)
MTNRRIASWVVCLLLAACLPATAQPSEPAGTISPLRGNLYRAQDGARVTVFRVEPDGIVVIDPMSNRFARFLEQQFADRFPGRPVKYVVYTGVDLERVGGAAVFDRTAEVIAHESFNDRSTAARQRAPELSQNVLFAESRFAMRRTLFDGEASIDLIYPGPGAIGAQTLVYFRHERVLFAASHPSLTAPFSNREVRPAAIAQWTATAAEIEFDLLVDGSGATATRADVMAAVGYARAIMAGLENATLRDLSAAQLQSGVTVARFDGTPFAQVRDADLAALYRRTSVLLLDAFGAALANRVPEDPTICSGASCKPETGPGFLAGAGFSIARLRLSAEFGTGTAVDITVGDSFRLRSRQSHVSFLAGGRIGPPRGLNVTLLGGVRFAKNVFTAQLVTGLRIDESEESMALAFGSDVTVPLSRNVAIVVPFRFTPSMGVFPYSNGGLDVRAGVGLSFLYHRRAM